LRSDIGETAEIMKRNVLVAGGCGFVGQHTVRAFKSAGFEVVDIGHGCAVREITPESLSTIKVLPDLVINCAGSGSVGASFEDPFLDFRKTVDSTLALLEFIRLKAPKAKLIQLSSPAVQGMHADSPIKISDPRNPVSPYGLHKSFAEDLCVFYGKTYALNIAIIRFFSLYGPGLKKQLLWDACRKIKDNPRTVEFWGNGQETRDWLHIDDALRLMMKIADDQSRGTEVFNGGSGIRSTIHEVLLKLVQALGSTTEIGFNGKSRMGDPKFYQADITHSLKLGWRPEMILEEGIKQYVEWFKREKI